MFKFEIYVKDKEEPIFVTTEKESGFDIVSLLEDSDRVTMYHIHYKNQQLPPSYFCWYPTRKLFLTGEEF